MNDKSYAEMSWSDTDITFVSSERSSIDRMIPSLYLGSDAGMSNPRLSYGSDINIDGNYSFESVHHPRMSMDSLADSPEFSYVSHDTDGVLSSSHATVS